MKKGKNEAEERNSMRENFPLKKRFKNIFVKK